MSKRCSKAWITGLLTACMILTMVPFAFASSAAPAKNVIVLMTDGTGATHTAITRWYLGGGALPQDGLIVGGVRTYGADSIITDSAPAASAFATGREASVTILFFMECGIDF